MRQASMVQAYIGQLDVDELLDNHVDLAAPSTVVSIHIDTLDYSEAVMYASKHMSTKAFSIFDKWAQQMQYVLDEHFIICELAEEATTVEELEYCLEFKAKYEARIESLLAEKGVRV